MRGIRTITIDLDDTLWAIHPVIRRAERGLYAWYGEKYPRIADMFTPEAMFELRQDIIDEFPDQCHDLTFLRRTVIGRLGVAAGYGESPVDEAMDVFHALRNDVDIFPEVRPALDALGRSFTVIAVTNGNANLDSIGIRDLFDGFVSAATAGAAKPARRIFDAAVAAGGADVEQTLHVGDHPETDVAGAQNAGLRTVWVNRESQDWPGHLQPPDATVKDIGELPALLDAESR